MEDNFHDMLLWTEKLTKMPRLEDLDAWEFEQKNPNASLMNDQLYDFLCLNRETDTTPLDSRSHESHSTEEKKVPIRFRRTNAHRARNGTLQCSAGPEWHGCHGTQRVT